MVIPMKKYTILVYHQELDGFLDALRKEGVVHIEAAGGQPESSALEELHRELSRSEKALAQLKHLAPKGSGDQDGDPEEILTTLEKGQAARDRILAEMGTLKKEIEQLEPWGDFDPESFTRLEEQGIICRFFTAAARHFTEEWLTQYSMAAVAHAGKIVYLVSFGAPGEEMDLPVEELSPPMASLKQRLRREEECRKELEEAEAVLTDVASRGVTPLEQRIEQLQELLIFEKARVSGTLTVADRLVVLEGWVPTTKTAPLDAFLLESGAVFMVRDAEEGDDPPVTVKNGFFSRLFEPIAKLFSLPDYHELDLTSAFAPFFALFFGLCLGDAGYGVVIFLMTFVARFKLKKELKPLMTLAMVLAVCTIVVGMATGTVFGVWLSTVPAWKDKVLIQDTGVIFYLSLGIGVVQILFGMLIQAANRYRSHGFLASLSPIGWFLMVASLVTIMLKGSIPFLANSPAGEIAGITIWVGIGLIMFFNDVKANIFVRLGKGVWELYNITGFFGDVLSYVRLFALGISSAILGLVVNNIASNFQTIPVVGPLIFVLVLIIGHTGNLLLSGLGSFVHPMRLTFVEFYNNAGFEGGGRKYTPFAQKRKNNVPTGTMCP